MNQTTRKGDKNMITLPKNNKKVEQTLKTFIDIYLHNDENVTHRYKNDVATPAKNEELAAFYQKMGLTDYQVTRSHKEITELPFNRTVNLDFMKKNSNYKPYTIKKGQYEPTNYAVHDEMGNSYIPLVTFDQDITLPMICEDEIGWMTPVLFEHETMKPAVERAHGHVLVMGLGIGFYPFNILQKEEVKKVTIIEYNEDIIRLFKEHILPQFPRKEAIEIIHGSAYDYLNNAYIQQYDYTFVDIWRNNEDGVLILSNCLQNLDFTEDLSIDFWIEKDILEEVKFTLKAYLYKLKQGGLEKLLTGSISEERTVENFITYDKIHRFFKKKTVKIKNNAELMAFVNDRNLLRELLKSF